MRPPFNGRNSFNFDNGSSYEGEWRNFLPDGYGTYIWPNGSKYVGFFEAGCFHGDGKLYDRNGTCYMGKFERDVLQGNGNVEHYSGNKFQGNFLNSRANGSGKYSFRKTVVEGVWENGHFSTARHDSEETSHSAQPPQAAQPEQTEAGAAGDNRKRHSSEWKGKGLAGVTFSNIVGMDPADMGTLDVKSGKLAQRRAKPKSGSDTLAASEAEEAEVASSDSLT
uniref:MORN repeat-containing protein 5 n=2 Tax=Guillardia theta TaxID=55529 RepID=A0A7S4M0B0_GUITH